MQKVFLSFVVAPTWEVLQKIAPKSYDIANGHLMHNLRLWTELADQGNASAVLEDPEKPAQMVHVSPISSPFHNNDRNTWCACYPAPPPIPVYSHYTMKAPAGIMFHRRDTIASEICCCVFEAALRSVCCTSRSCSAVSSK
jgi:hypothetical protein